MSTPPFDREVAPEGAVWVCMACGKTRKTRWEFSGSWDESCMVNAMLCREDGVKLATFERWERRGPGPVQLVPRPADAPRVVQTWTTEPCDMLFGPCTCGAWHDRRAR